MGLRIIGQGGESTVYDLDDGRVLKVGNGLRDEDSVRLWLRTSAAEFLRIEKRLGDFLPETVYYEALPVGEVPDGFAGKPGIIQEKVSGRALAELEEDEVREPVVLSQLIQLMEIVRSLSKESGIVVDWSGTVSGVSERSLLNPFRSGNVFVTDTGEVKLVDTNTLTDKVAIVEGEDGEMEFVAASLLGSLLSSEWITQAEYRKYICNLALLKTARLGYSAFYSVVFGVVINRLRKT